MRADQRIRCQVKSPYLEINGISDLGRLRAENEDFIYLDREGRFILLADGMGGHERGAEASETAVDVVKNVLSAKTANNQSQRITDVDGLPGPIACLHGIVDDAIHQANTVLYERNQALQLTRFMGTTIVGFIPVEREYFLWFHIGDSRLYRMRNGNLKCLTRDHSAYKEWEERGRHGREPEKNIITRAVGPKKRVSADIKWDSWVRGDTYILCSDGLSDMITDEEMMRIVKGRKDVETTAGDLVEAAIQAGGKDNISVIVCLVLN